MKIRKEENLAEKCPDRKARSVNNTTKTSMNNSAKNCMEKGSNMPDWGQYSEKNL